MLYLSTLKGLTRDGSLETLAEVGHPGPGGDASEVCNRYQDVIAATPVGDELRARYGQILFVVDNQVRSQLEFPPPPSPATEDPAEPTNAGGGPAASSGEGGEESGEGQSETTEEGQAETTEEGQAEGETLLDLPGDESSETASASTTEASPGSMSPKGKRK